MAIAAPAHSSAEVRLHVDIGGGKLSSALVEFARETGTELLFDQALVRDINVGPIRGRYTKQAALTRLLAGTRLRFRQSAGTFIIFAGSAPAPDPAPAEALPVPEILVIGRRSQNADIRRRENDIQPYQVATGEQVVRAHRDNLDQYFRSHVSSNTQVLPPSLLDNGETASAIDLRGLGSEGTLILLDGRRMPSIPSPDNPLRFRQPDLNAIPLHAIERVETLTGTAGGIYGFGAIGGVVNVVLKRDYRGAELHGTAGISSRGDARRFALEGRLGFTPDKGRTDVMVHLSHTRSEPLLVGQRGYEARVRQEVRERLPDLYERVLFYGDYFPDVLAIYDIHHRDLVLKPEFGGISLGSNYASLPAGFRGTPAELAAALSKGAGQLDHGLGSPQERSHLGSHANTSAAILNIRRKLAGGIEAYLDAVYLRNDGRHRRYGSGIRRMDLAPDAPHNPFDNSLLIHYPIWKGGLDRASRFTTRRYTAGLVAALPLDWGATAEATFGKALYRLDSTDRYHSQGNLDLKPFEDWNRFQEAAGAKVNIASLSQRIANHYKEQSLRLAGPLFRITSEPMVLTLSAERRHDRVPSHARMRKLEVWGEPRPYWIAARNSRTTAFYGELRAPLTRGGFPLLRDLEVQIALRRETLRAEFSKHPEDWELANLGGAMRRSFTATAYTAGAKTSPLPWLMLRGSYATGGQPPPLEELVGYQSRWRHACFNDRKRERWCTPDETDDELEGKKDPTQGVDFKTAGNPDLEVVRASTLSVGAVLNPEGRGPRLAVDYSRVRRTGDPIWLTTDQVLALEDEWPERVVRQPLTEADRARGYSGGLITTLDQRAANGGERFVESVDARLEWPLRAAGGQLRLHAATTRQIRNQRKDLFSAAQEDVGHRTGPLKWRGNAGLHWTSGATSLGASVQYFGKYHVRLPRDNPFEIAAKKVLQGSFWIKPQAYLDLYAGHHFQVGRSSSAPEIEVSVGVVNVLDKAPSMVAGEGTSASLHPGYSRYGDPRRRRFELTLSTKLR